LAWNGGSSGCATAPPEDVFPRTMNVSQVGMMAQRPITTIMVEQKSAATAETR
jgi:hypothetical protein